MIYRCAACGRKTEPFVFIGVNAIGPTCSRKMGLTPAKTRKGSAIRFAKPVKRQPSPQSDLFDQLKDDDGILAPLATDGPIPEWSPALVQGGQGQEGLSSGLRMDGQEPRGQAHGGRIAPDHHVLPTDAQSL